MSAAGSVFGGIFGGTGAQAVAWSLVHFLWQGALVALGLAAALALGRGWSARLRYAVSAGALLLMLALPVATAVRLAAALTPGPSPSSPLPVPGRGETSKTAGSAVYVSMEERPRENELLGAAGARLESWLPAVFSLWLAGVLFLSLFNFGGWLQARRLARRETRAVAEVWTARLAELRRRLGIGRAVEMLESARVTVPAVVGWLRPVILVPASALAGLTPQQLEAVLAHELAHVRRHDYLVNLLQTVVETLLFYHPAVWWASRQVRRERESCCDDLALAVCGDRIGYARALAALEGLRAPAPRLAMAATGGSLLARIRRIVSAPTPVSDRSSAWLTGAVAVLTLCASVALQHASVSAEPAAGAVKVAAAQPAHPAPPPPPAPRPASPAPPAPPAPPPPAPPIASVTTNRGTWRAERKANGIQLEMDLHESSAGHHHDMEESNLYPEKDLVGFGTGSAVRFELRRAAGTFRYEGSFDGSKGSGTFTFQASAAYVQEMASLGYQVKSENLLQLALFDVSPAFVHELASLGYSKVSLERLVEFRIHGVKPELIKALNELGLRNLSPEKLIEMQIHGATPDFVRSLAAVGYSGLGPDDLIQFRIHGVKAELIQALKDAGLSHLKAQEMIQLQIHGARPDYIRAMGAAGYHGLTADSLVQFRIHGVSPEYVRDLAAAGYPSVSPEDLIQFRIHGVTADFIRDQESKGHKHPSPEELIDLRIHSGR